MATRQLCSCGYPYVENREARRDGMACLPIRCQNPWHPKMPGGCPKCATMGPHPVLTMGGRSATVKCRRCGHVWKPAELQPELLTG